MATIWTNSIPEGMGLIHGADLIHLERVSWLERSASLAIHRMPGGKVVSDDIWLLHDVLYIRRVGREVGSFGQFSAKCYCKYGASISEHS